MEDFRINNAFTVMPDKNMVNEVRLEPRLMKLLCLLAENPRQVISREKIIETLWQGYGGGDEGLTQAISFLRKLLNDHEKKIIETVPKAGYIFHADVVVGENVTEKAPEKRETRRPVFIITAVIILILFWLLLYRKTPKVPYAPKAPEERVEQGGVVPEKID